MRSHQHFTPTIYTAVSARKMLISYVGNFDFFIRYFTTFFMERLDRQPPHKEYMAIYRPLHSPNSELTLVSSPIRRQRGRTSTERKQPVFFDLPEVLSIFRYREKLLGVRKRLIYVGESFRGTLVYNKKKKKLVHRETK